MWYILSLLIKHHILFNSYTQKNKKWSFVVLGGVRSHEYLLSNNSSNSFPLYWSWIKHVCLNTSPRSPLIIYFLFNRTQWILHKHQQTPTIFQSIEMQIWKGLDMLSVKLWKSPSKTMTSVSIPLFLQWQRQSYYCYY